MIQTDVVAQIILHGFYDSVVSPCILDASCLLKWKKTVQFSTHNYNKFMIIFIIFGTSHPDIPIFHFTKNLENLHRHKRIT